MDPETRRVSQPGPEPVYSAYVVSESDKGVDDLRVTAVATPQSTPGQVEGLLQRLVVETKVRQPVPVVASEPAGLETLLRSLLSGPCRDTVPCRFCWNTVSGRSY